MFIELREAHVVYAIFFVWLIMMELSLIFKDIERLNNTLNMYIKVSECVNHAAINITKN